ncbi:type I-C CRISPR-associated endonuclease Cas1c [Halorhodospira halochloris]|uniref:type I-C CRISPR-associated endonuclease Cas1c n=1 Tax=Halorhodospira halochloris TaxID=1052 RepID=UPI001EE870BB|nr:type I-C CRISPR-associated endonuclease Cas1c [Halorhodospira halochloris]
MRRHRNTIYVTTDGALLRKDGANVVMQVEGQEGGRVPAHMLDGIVCLGRVTVSYHLIGYCADNGITITYLSSSGRFLARVEGPVSGNVLLRKEQYRRTDDLEQCPIVVQGFLAGKIHNQRAVLRRSRRDHGDKMTTESTAALDDAENTLNRLLKRLPYEQDNERLRGMEGEAGRTYFKIFDHFIRREGLRFSGRTRRPPMDEVNALISFLYTILTHDCRSALEAVGLDPQVGFLHRLRPGRPSLALDLLEEFRPVLADRLALTLINRGQIETKDFTVLDNGAVIMSDETRKTILTAYQERKDAELRHPFLGEKTTVGLLPALQAQLLARHLRGDIDGYPPFLWK